MPGSPFSCKVSPGNTQPRVPVSGSGIELSPVGLPAEIKIEGVTGKILYKDTLERINCFDYVFPL